ncbi:MAG: hypothetical protein JW940_19665 [Polyangiaceae bacterium]|nr:hypothetical protein [Polyangiaceae bacterium]
MQLNAWLAFGTPVAVAAIAVKLALPAVIEPEWTSGFLAAPLLGILLSSAIDWYVILPFRDGVEGLPACRIDRVSVQARRRYTKLWVAHRLACEVLIAGALLVAAWGVISHYTGEPGAVLSVISFLGGASAVISVAWRRWVLGGLRFCLRQGPALGAWVTGYSYTRDEGRRRCHGFLRDVSLDNGLKVARTPEAQERFIALSDAVPDISVAREDYACTAAICRGWLRSGSEISCEVHLVGAFTDKRGTRHAGEV